MSEFYSKIKNLVEAVEPVVPISKRFFDATDAPKHNLVAGHSTAMFVAWKEFPVGTALVPASEHDYAEFGKGVFRTAKGEMKFESIVKVYPKSFAISFVDQDAYQAGNLVWGERIPLTRGTIFDMKLFNDAFE